MKMNKMDNKYLIITLIVIVVLFIYYTNGIITDGGVSERINEQGWMHSYNWGWFPSIVFLLFGLLVGWMLYKKKS